MKRVLLLGFIFAIGWTLYSTTDVFAQGALLGASSTWDHNGSAVDLFANQARRRFYYQIPRNGMQEEGVKRGTLLFDGRKNGNQYSGTAYVFSSVCGRFAYEVSGPVSSDYRRVTMYGQAPRIDSECQVIGYSDDVLVFDFMSANAPVVARDNSSEAAEAARVKEARSQAALRAAQQRDFESQLADAERARILAEEAARRPIAAAESAMAQSDRRNEQEVTAGAVSLPVPTPRAPNAWWEELNGPYSKGSALLFIVPFLWGAIKKSVEANVSKQNKIIAYLALGFVDLLIYTVFGINIWEPKLSDIAKVSFPLLVMAILFAVYTWYNEHAIPCGRDTA